VVLGVSAGRKSKRNICKYLIYYIHTCEFMKHTPGARRHHRARNNNGRRQHFVKSDQPQDRRVRHNAIKSLERYLSLAKDALSGGDIVLAENYFQHADHYQRVVNANSTPADQPVQFQRETGSDGFDEDPVPSGGSDDDGDGSHDIPAVTSSAVNPYGRTTHQPPRVPTQQPDIDHELAHLSFLQAPAAQHKIETRRDTDAEEDPQPQPQEQRRSQQRYRRRPSESESVPV
jgi:hypothetical protein